MKNYREEKASKTEPNPENGGFIKDLNRKYVGPRRGKAVLGVGRGGGRQGVGGRRVNENSSFEMINFRH